VPVFLVSVLVMVPSGFSRIVFSFDVTVPLLFTLVVSVLEIVCEQPTNEQAKADPAAKITNLRVFMLIISAMRGAPALGQNPC